MLNHIAVLIDADNASAKTIDDILSAIEKLGHIATKKIYGDWSLSGLSASWQEAILRHAIDPMQQFAYVKGKNATDIALVIEAMDLLHSGDYDGFCLVSSDSDFASLAVRIRKSGLKVYGFGRKEAVTSFRQACDEFFEVENLSAQKPNAQKQADQSTAWDNKKLKSDTKLLNALRDSVTAHVKDEWANYSQIVSHFKQHHADIDIKKYGYNKLIQLYQVVDLFLVNTDKQSKQLIIKLKNHDTPKPNEKYTTKQLQAEQALLQAIHAGIEKGKDDKGWYNLGQISSYMSQNYDIDIKKYGYKKFSDLITAIRLFDIQKRQNGVYIKLKNTQPKTNKTPIQTTSTPQTETHQPLTLADIKDKPLILNGDVHIYVYTQANTDTVLWRLGDNKKVRHDGDMIFYGQTQSDDGMIELDGNDGDVSYDLFTCRLPQSSDIRQMLFTISHEFGGIAYPHPAKVVIEQAGKNLFVGEFALMDDMAHSAMLFSLVNVGKGWQLMPRGQLIRHDLRQLCTAFGIEVDDWKNW